MASLSRVQAIDRRAMSTASRHRPDSVPVAYARWNERLFFVFRRCGGEILASRAISVGCGGSKRPRCVSHVRRDEGAGRGPAKGGRSTASGGPGPPPSWGKAGANKCEPTHCLRMGCSGTAARARHWTLHLGDGNGAVFPSLTGSPGSPALRLRADRVLGSKLDDPLHSGACGIERRIQSDRPQRLAAALKQSGAVLEPSHSAPASRSAPLHMRFIPSAR